MRRVVSTQTQNQVLKMLLYASLIGLATFSETIYTPALPLLAHVFHVSTAHIKYSVVIYIIAFAIGQLFYGYCVRHVSIRRLLLVGIGIYSVGILVVLGSHYFAELMIGRCLQGVGVSVGSTLVRVIMKEQYSFEEQKRYFPVILGMVGFMPVLGPFFGGLILHFLSWIYIFVLLLVLGFCVMFLIWREIEVGCITQTHAAPLTWRYFFPDKLFMSYIMLNSLFLAILLVYSLEAPFFIIQILHYSPLVFGCMSLCIALCYLLGSIVSSRILVKQQLSRIIQIGIVVTCGGCVILFLFSFIYSLSLSLLIVPMCMVMFGLGLAKSNTSIAAMNTLPLRSGQASSLIGFWQMLISGLIASLCIHVISQRLIALAGVFLVISGLLLFLMHIISRMHRSLPISSF